jgi:hypothetical protein
VSSSTFSGRSHRTTDLSPAVFLRARYRCMRSAADRARPVRGRPVRWRAGTIGVIVTRYDNSGKLMPDRTGPEIGREWA